MTSPDPLDREIARRVGDGLRAIGFDGPGIIEVLGSDLPLIAQTATRGPMLHRTRDGSPLDLAIRLFVGLCPLDVDVAAGALGAGTVQDWLSVGLVAMDGRQLRPLLALRAAGRLVVATDPSPGPGDPGLAPDHVMGLSPSTLGLAELTVRRPVTAALDVGCGGGYQALMAAAHADRVVATDLNPRAVAMARLNAALNGIDLDVRQGDMLAPARGERFGLVVSNPPFIIGPDITHQFLSTSRAGDDVCRELAQQAPVMLEPGGYCQFLANWISLEGQPWQERLRGWFTGTGCDVWVIRASADAPDLYASTWITAVTQEVEEYERRFASWMDTFAAGSIDAVHYGLITMRRRTRPGDGWMRFSDVSNLFTSGTGADIDRLMQAHDWQESRGDDALAAAAISVGPDARAVMEASFGTEGWRNDELHLGRSTGLGFRTPVSAELFQLVSRLDGTRTLADAIDEMVPTTPEFDQARRDILESVRELVSVGLLVPVGESEPVRGE